MRAQVVGKSLATAVQCWKQRTALPGRVETKLVKSRAYERIEALNAALAAGEISEGDWYREVASIITPAYLAGDNPRSQSGQSGDDAHWTHARSLIADAIERDGTFLDIGCASGYLMECLQRWTAERGHRIEPYGLDIAPELAMLARQRLPHWASRIFVGNALSWQPPMRFDVVRTGLEYVPVHRQRDLVERLLNEVVAPDGRLIIGTYNEERDDLRIGPSQQEMIAAWGLHIAGRIERRYWLNERHLYRIVWIDASGRTEKPKVL